MAPGIHCPARRLYLPRSPRLTAASGSEASTSVTRPGPAATPSLNHIPTARPPQAQFTGSCPSD
eukprot:421495-Hanusia_phi.AAC.1